VKWQQPLGGATAQFGAHATVSNRVLWCNDIEGGFSVSRFLTVGTIPDDEYWGNQDSLCLALRRLASDEKGVSRACEVQR
jgi:hypothetical protein